MELNININKALWEHFQQDSERFEVTRPRQEYLAHFVPTGCRALNIGIGGSAILESIMMHKGVDVHAIDLDEKIVNLLSNIPQLEGKAKIGKIESIPFESGIFDRVICSELFEHLDDDQLQTGLSEIYRVLKDGGYLLGTVPVRENLTKAIVICPHCKVEFHPLGHCRSFESKDLYSKLSIHFKNVVIREKLFIYTKNLALTSRVLCFLRKVRISLGGSSAANNFFFKAQKQ